MKQFCSLLDSFLKSPHKRVFGCFNIALLVYCVLATGLTRAQTTYNLSSGQLPPCSTSWSVSGTTYTCNGDGRVTLASGSIVTASTASTIVAANGFNLTSSTVGSPSVAINLQSTYGTVNATSSEIYGNIQAGSGVVTLGNTNVQGAVTSSGNINLTGGTIRDLVTSTSNTITANGTNFQNGARANSGISITGGVLAGSFTMTSNNPLTLDGVTMTSGSITGASTVSITNSTLGSNGSSITISSNSGPITVNNSTVYGNLTAPNYSTVNVTNGAQVYGTCQPNSTPANACSPNPPPCLLVSGIVGQYFNNTSLSGSPANSRVDSQINYDWGNAAPGPNGINADQFSIRWNGLLRVTQSGNYRFQTASDDGVRLWVNNVLLINNWTDHSNTTDTSADVALVAGEVYSIRLEFYENGGQALIRLRWLTPGAGSYVPIPEGPTPTLGAGLYHCTTTEVCAGVEPAGGIRGEYFNNMTMTGTAAGTRVDGPIDYIWNQSAPGVNNVNADEFSIRWSGRLRATMTGNYQFQTRSDDGVRLWVNDQLLIDQWNDHAATNHTSGNVYLVAGQVYPLRMEFYERFIDAEIRLRWLVPGSSTFVAIPRGPTPSLGAGLYHCPTTPVVSYYSISHSGTGVTCEAEPILITARDANGDAIAPSSGTTAVLATAPATGAWVGGNSFVFNGTDTSFIKYLQQLTPTTLDINVNDGSATEIPSADPNIIFSDVGLRFYGNASLVPLQNQVAGVLNNSPVIRAVQTNTDTGACEARVVGTRTARMAYECVNPSTCSAGQTFTVNGRGVTANPGGNITNYADVPLTFDNTGTASIPLNFSDVGMMRLHATVSLPAQGNDPPFVLAGSSNPFVVKPYTLAVSAIVSDSGINNPGTTSSGAGFIAAGENFSVSVEARNFAGGRTPNFGNESISERNNVALRLAQLIYPSGGVIGELTGGAAGSFSAIAPAGTMRSSAISWNEAGTIQLQPVLTDRDYLGAGDVAAFTTSGNVGRFYPDHFSLGFAQAANSCDTFSYMNDPDIELIYRVEARSVGGSITTNYHSATYSGTAQSTHHAEENNALDLSARVLASSSAWTNGVMDFDTNNPAIGFTITRQATGAPDGPFRSTQIGLRLLDSLDNRQLRNRNMNASTTGDCISENNCDAVQLGNSLSLIYGRMHIKDAFGPEQSPLPMFWQTEFWNGNTFVLNGADNCTQLPLTNVSFVDSSSSVNAASDTISVTRSGATSVFNFADPDPSNVVGDGLTTTAIAFQNGRAGIQYGAPGAQVTYPILTDLTGFPHLQYDWNQDTIYADRFLPRAEIRFSNYRGHDRIIYWREDFR